MTGRCLSQAARSIWAKSPDPDGSWLPLWQHMDDSAGVAEWLFDNWLPRSVQQFLANEFADDLDSARCAVSFLAAVHDIGKATPSFAIQHESLAQMMREHGLYMPPTRGELVDRHKTPHALAGHHLLIRWLESQRWERRQARTWGVIVGGHHGVPPDAKTEQDGSPSAVPQLYGTDLWHTARTELFDRVAARTGAVEYFEVWSKQRLSQPFQVLVTGIVIMADWIASNIDLFPYLNGSPSDTGDGDRAVRALSTLSLPSPWLVAPTTVNTEELFHSRFDLPDGSVPRPVQRGAVEVALGMTDPGLIIIEAPMGEGKTEAALAAAELMAARWGAGGAFVALPTQATSDAMFERIVDWLDRLGSNEQQVGGSIMLSHGKARFNRLFQGLLRAGWRGEVERDERRNQGSRRNRTSHAVVAHSWLAGRKKAQLANFIVGTIDQLLFAGLKARHLALRHIGLAGKVVILDEVHAYDAFMNSYLTRVLTWLGAYRVPVIALSATLPVNRRLELLNAYLAGQSTTDSDPPMDRVDVGGDLVYPVITWTEAAGVRWRGIDASDRSTVVRLDRMDDGDLTSVLSDLLADGGCALVVRNTVRRVLTTATMLQEVFPGEVLVAHSRYIAADRVRNDEELLKRFGPSGPGVKRPNRSVVVASQVVEQSLDLDFDILITDLAPIDLVLQRMGRLHRHRRGSDESNRPVKLREARTYITGIEFSDGVPDMTDVSGHGSVYDEYVMLRSAALLASRIGSTITLPTDIAPLVNVVYGDETVGPEGWGVAMEKAAEESRRRTERRLEKASAFQIGPPGKAGRAIVGWVSAGVGDADDGSEGHGQVRDGAPSLEVILVEVDAEGRWQTPSWLGKSKRGLSIPRDTAPANDLADIMMSCSIRLPLEFSNADSEEALLHATPEAWEASPLIYRYPALVIDQSGWGEIAGRTIRYTPQRGLEVIRT